MFMLGRCIGRKEVSQPIISFHTFFSVFNSHSHKIFISLQFLLTFWQDTVWFSWYRNACWLKLSYKSSLITNVAIFKYFLFAYLARNYKFVILFIHANQISLHSYPCTFAGMHIHIRKESISRKLGKIIIIKYNTNNLCNYCYYQRWFLKLWTEISNTNILKYTSWYWQYNPSLIISNQQSFHARYMYKG